MSTLPLKELRRAAGLSQSHLSDYIGIDRSLISRFERGERRAPDEVCEKITTVCRDRASENYELVLELAGDK